MIGLAMVSGCTSSSAPIDGSETTVMTSAGSNGSDESGDATDPDLEPILDLLPDPDPFAELETAAAIDDLQVIVDAAFAVFQIEQPPVDGQPADWPLHRCPVSWSLDIAGSSGITPEPSVDCNEGPERRCVPTDGPIEPGYYPVAHWLNNPVWIALGFAKLDPHAFHYEFVAINASSGYGACMFTARAHADLDGDFVFSTYERRGSADENGVVEDPMLYVTLTGE